MEFLLVVFGPIVLVLARYAIKGFVRFYIPRKMGEVGAEMDRQSDIRKAREKRIPVNQYRAEREGKLTLEQIMEEREERRRAGKDVFSND